MDNSTYEPPKADLGNSYREEEETIPSDIAKKIKGGWIAAIISGLITLAIVFFAKDSFGFQIDYYIFIEIALVFGLAFGIYKKSRTCATIMFIYFLASKILIISQTGKFNGIIISILFLVLYFQAMTATFQYHSWKASRE